MSGLGARVLTAVVLAGVAFFCLFAGAYPLMALLWLFAIGGLWEFATLVQNYQNLQSTNPLPDKIMVVAMGSVVYFVLSGIFMGWLPSISWVLLPPLLMLLAVRELYAKPMGIFLRFGLYFSGILYTVVPLAMVNAIAQFQHTYQPLVVLGVFFLIWSNDTGAYFAGKYLGKTPLLKRISPKKTWEGSIGGAVLTLLIALVAYWLVPALSLIDWLVVAVLSIVVGTWGDLAESMLKRNVNVKDSGTILPGHGGVLDRLDAVYMVIPFVWAWLVMS